MNRRHQREAGKRARAQGAAFTLVELLVVIAVIVLLLALLLPSLREAQDRAKLAVCTSNLRQVGVAAFMYADDYQGAVAGSRNSAGPELQTAEGWTQLVLGNYVPSARLEVFYCPDSYGRLRQPVYSAGFSNTDRNRLVNNPATGWLTGYFDLAWAQPQPGGTNVWAIYGGGLQPANWFLRTSIANFNARPIAGDQIWVNNNGWPNAAGPLTWPAHGRRTMNFVGQNALYGGGHVAFVLSSVSGFGTWAGGGGHRKFPPQGPP